MMMMMDQDLPYTYEENYEPNLQHSTVHTALRNHNRKVFEEMSSWTTLTL